MKNEYSDNISEPLRHGLVSRSVRSTDNQSTLHSVAKPILEREHFAQYNYAQTFSYDHGLDAVFQEGTETAAATAPTIADDDDDDDDDDDRKLPATELYHLKEDESVTFSKAKSTREEEENTKQQAAEMTPAASSSSSIRYSQVENLKLIPVAPKTIFGFAEYQFADAEEDYSHHGNNNHKNPIAPNQLYKTTGRSRNHESQMNAHATATTKNCCMDFSPVAMEIHVTTPTTHEREEELSLTVSH
ncbi:hypothetical protein ACA910_017481 [Epithemia clementina (nom. ined.)]